MSTSLFQPAVPESTAKPPSAPSTGDARALTPATPPWRARLRRLLPGRRACVAVGSLLAVSAVGTLAVAAYGVAPHQRPISAVAFVPQAAADTALDEAARRKLAASIENARPRGVYVTVDTYRNRLRVHQNDTVLREAVCSTGSGAVVRDPRNGRLWIFNTPTGERRVQSKQRDPVWKKPDWAFVEEGYLPPKKASLKVDDFSLGDYALYLGDGYIIHGTVFQTLLGQAITHGCIRLGDKDLEYVYQTVPAGARVYLF
jgi:L,D-transpeptidase YbiS